MGDLISRKAAIDAIESHTRDGDELYPLSEADRIKNYSFEVAASCVHNLPSADAVEVVRCKDCVYSYIFEPWDGNDASRYCRSLRTCYAKDSDMCVADDDFCKYGRRKGGEQHG